MIRKKALFLFAVLLYVMIQLSCCVYRQYRKNNATGVLSYRGRHSSVSEADKIQNLQFLPLSECVFVCRKLSTSICKSINYVRNNYTSTVNCTLIKADTEPDKSSQQDDRIGFLRLYQNKPRVETTEVTKDLCSGCEYANIFNAKVGFICDCRKVQPRQITSCKEVYNLFPTKLPSLVTLLMTTGEHFDVYCECSADQKERVLMMHRNSGELLNQPTLQNYENGFGDLQKTYWLGLEKLHMLSRDQPVDMKIEYMLQDWRQYGFQYEGLTVDSAERGYGIFYQNISFTNPGSCPEIQCLTDTGCLKREDVCNNLLSPRKCTDHAEIMHCGVAASQFHIAGGNGHDIVVGGGTHAICLVTCLKYYRAGNTAINGVKRKSDGTCICIQEMTSILLQERFIGCELGSGNVCQHNKVLGDFSKSYDVSDSSNDAKDVPSCAKLCVFKRDHQSFDLTSMLHDNLEKKCYCFSESNALWYEQTAWLHYTTFSCGSGKISCDGKCVETSKLCDGIEDCGTSRLDERFCPRELRDNFKCNYQKPFADCQNGDGFWWGGCKSRYGHSNVPTRSDGVINWNHANVRYIKITLQQSQLSRADVTTCRDVYLYMRCHDNKYVYFELEKNVWRKLYCRFSPAVHSRKVILTELLRRTRSFPQTITSDHVINGTDIFTHFQWVGIKYLPLFFRKKPITLQAYRHGEDDKIHVALLENFTTSGKDGMQVTYSTQRKLGANLFFDPHIPMNTSFQFCNHSSFIFWWWGCDMKQPLQEKPSKNNLFHASDYSTKGYSLNLIEPVD